MGYASLKASFLGLVITVFTVVTPLFGAHAQTSKSDVLKVIDELLVANSLSLKVIENSIKSKDPRTASLSSNVAMSMKEEYLLRQDFLNRLKFQVVNHYKPATEKEFLNFALTKILKQEESEGRQAQALHRFSKTLLDVFEQNLERTQNPFEVIQYYFSQSKLSTPLAAKEFIEKQDYVGRSLMQSARKPAPEPELESYIVPLPEEVKTEESKN